MRPAVHRPLCGRQLPPAWWDHPLHGSRRIVQSLLRRRFGKTQVVVPFAGTRIVADLETPLGLGFYRYGYWDDVLDEILAVLRPGDTFIDGGANVGIMAIAAARKVGLSGRVIALEPATPARHALTRNVTLGGHSNVTILPYALGERAGMRPFVIMDKDPGLSSFSPEHPEDGTLTTVDVCTLDHLVATEHLDRVRLVKLDIEGAEVAALRGAHRLLDEGQADFIVENEPEHLRRQGVDEDDLFSLLGKYGYVPRPLNHPNVLFSRSRGSDVRN